MSAPALASSNTRGLNLPEEEKHLVPVHAPSSLRVLLVEDSREYAQLIEVALSGQTLCDFEVERVPRLEMAIARLEQTRYDVVLLDLTLPDSDPETTIERVCARTSACAVLVLTASEDTHLALLAGRAGADDFIVKDRMNRKSLARKIIAVATRHRARLPWAQGSISEVAIEIGADPIAWARMLEGPVSAACDDAADPPVDERIFRDRLAHTIAQARENPRRFAVMVVELGHLGARADLAAHNLRNRVATTDTLARTGETAFSLIVDDVRNTAQADETARALLGCIESDRVAGTNESGMTASIGVAMYPDDGRDLESLLDAAEQAKREAVAAGGHEVRFCRALAFYQDNLQN